MVKLEVVDDEHFVEKPSTTKDGALLVEDDDDYTDTDSEISEADSHLSPDQESIYERFVALKDIIPPQTRARISSATSSIVNATSTGITYGGKGLWVLTTSVLLLGIPYALALGEEQQIMEEERQRGMMQEGQAGMIDGASEQK